MVKGKKIRILQTMTGPQTELKRMQSRKAGFRGMMDYKKEMEIGIRNILLHKNAKGTFAKKKKRFLTL